MAIDRARPSIDWRFIENSRTSGNGVIALLYLMRERYVLGAAEAGRVLRDDDPKNPLRAVLIDEVRQALQDPNSPIRYGSWCPESEARQYLSELLDAYDGR